MATSKESDCPNILMTTVGFPEEQSLRHIIRTRYGDGMPEDFIAIVMRDVLTALNFLHVSLSTGHKNVNSSNICVDTEEFLVIVKLVVHPLKDLAHPGPAWEKGRAPTDGIWGLGITALEMGYGSLPCNCNERADLASLGNNVIRILKLKLAYPDKKGKKRAKNKGKEKLESAEDRKLKGKGKSVVLDDQEIKGKAMQKGEGKLAMADDHEMKEKAMQKGKEKLELGDDPEGKELARQKGKEKLEVSDDQELKEKAKQKGKEKLEIADDQKGKEMAKKKRKEVKKLMIQLPVLEKLLNARYVKNLEKKLKRKKAMVVLPGKFKKAVKFFRKKKNDNADEREFSRDFLEVVLMCLEEQKLTTAKQILERPFLQQTIDQQEFDRRMRH